jgi:hypothetical protein
MQGCEGEFRVRPIFGRVDIVHELARQNDRRRFGREHFAPLAEGARSSPVELARVVIGGLEIL